MTFSKILIANRGEIACRIIRTARDMGYQTVAVFSDADASAPHIRQADEAVRIGPPPATDSYLRIDSIIAAAGRTGADAIHPGYGFLSENAEFAAACATANLTFIGPTPETIAIMADKSRAKAKMREAGIPILPGSPIATVTAAETVGFPLMVKAIAGGGGRGMRIVRDPSGLAEALTSAGREAQSAFGDATLMLEKLVEQGRHIEFQIFGDHHGHIVHLGERDCTAQRRRQKIIEESPSPVLTPALRARMAAAAIAAARAVGYINAGTVEFILDQNNDFYFLEMNTRLQVEHPVTECVTGLDLVEWQLRIAAGEPLPLAQDQVVFSGHAIEARLCTESPTQNFAPQTGAIQFFAPSNAAIRIDSGVESGSTVTPDYDSMVAKFIAHGATRADAIRKLTAALQSNPLLGLQTNAQFLRNLLKSQEFQAAQMHTSMIETWANKPILSPHPPTFPTLALAAALLATGAAGHWNRGSPTYSLTLRDESGADHPLTITQSAATTIQTNSQTTTIRILKTDGEKIWFDRDGIITHAIAITSPNGVYLATKDFIGRLSEKPAFAATEQPSDPSRLLAPVAGTLIAILPPGTKIATGDIVAVIEAMKIETRIPAAMDGTVTEIFASAGAQVTPQKLLAVLGSDA